jgi:hypothetical protein
MRQPQQESPVVAEHAGAGSGSLQGRMATTVQEIDREAARRVAGVLAVDEAAGDLEPTAELVPLESEPALSGPWVPRIMAAGALAVAAGSVLLLSAKSEHAGPADGSLWWTDRTRRSRAAVPTGVPPTVTSVIQVPSTVSPRFDAAARRQGAGHPVRWPRARGGNGHWYLLITTESPMSWEDARKEALRLGGDLATFTSLEETEHFVRVHADAGPQTAWIGLYQDDSSPDHSEPAGGWRWVSDEPLRWTFWSTGEPNELTGREHYANLWLNQSGTNGSWNDYQFGGPTSYIVEWSPDMGGMQHRLFDLIGSLLGGFSQDSRSSMP